MEEALDQEWVDLITKAKQMGIPADEVRTFLRRGRVKKMDSNENQPSHSEASF